MTAPPSLLNYSLSLARRYGTTGDPESAALLGLARALARYDASRGVSLRTYARAMILGELQHTARAASGWGRPRWEEIPRALRLQDEWEHLTPSERAWVEAHVPRPHEHVPVSLDVPQGDGDLLGESLPASGDAFAPLAERDWVRDLLSRLPPREALVVRMCVLEGRTQAEAGAVLGCTQMHVSRLRRKALVRLRRFWEEME